jgi:hypothetical protein
LGQVHRAELPDGTVVAVKVQYPEIEEIVRVDLKTLKRIFGVIPTHWGPDNRLGPATEGDDATSSWQNPYYPGLFGYSTQYGLPREPLRIKSRSTP